MVRKKISYNSETRQKAEEYRRNGFSYKKIYDLLKIPKSTLSTWFGKKFPGVANKKEQLIHLAEIRKLALESRKKDKEQEKTILRNRVMEEVQNYPLNDKSVLKSILSSLYWAEGAKYHNSPVVFTNTDPLLAKLFITLMRRCYALDENKFRIRIHLHHYHNITSSKKMWSELLDIPLNKFGKVYIKKRSLTKKFRRNFAGICFIKYNDNMLRREIMELAYQLANKIN